MSAELRPIHPKLSVIWAFPKYFHIRKLAEIMVFWAMCRKSFSSILSLVVGLTVWYRLQEFQSLLLWFHLRHCTSALNTHPSCWKHPPILLETPTHPVGKTVNFWLFDIFQSGFSVCGNSQVYLFLQVTLTKSSRRLNWVISLGTGFFKWICWDECFNELYSYLIKVFFFPPTKHHGNGSLNYPQCHMN